MRGHHETGNDPAVGLRPLGKPQPLAVRAYHAVRRDLLYGDLRGSSRLSEHALAKKYKISRTPIREVLQKLVIAGFLEAVPGGYVPKRLSTRDIMEIYDLRLLLEPIAAQLSASRITQVQLRELRRVAESTRAPFNNLNPEELTELNTYFHSLLAEASGNPALARVIKAVIDRLAAHHVFSSPVHLDSVDWAHGHDNIVAALGAKDPNAAASSVETHLAFVRTALLSVLSAPDNRAYDALGALHRPRDTE